MLEVTSAATSFIEITCLPIPTWEGLWTSSSDRSYGSTVNVTCSHGNETYQPGDIGTQIHCGHNGQWSGEIPRCTGINALISFTLLALSLE